MTESTGHTGSNGSPRRATLRIDSLGFATTLQDGGRLGFAHLGVPRSGPVDRSSAALANRLVGNPTRSTVIETLGGLVVTATGAATVATPELGRTTLTSGESLRVSPARGRRWTHLAVRGGVVADTVLGSASHDTLSGLGPTPLAGGDELAIGDDPRSELPTDFAPPRHSDDRPVTLWNAPADDRRLVGEVPLSGWVVTDDVSRVGLRLRRSDGTSGDGGATAGDPAHVTVPPRPSGGLVLGAVQLTPAGEAIVMLADHPTTGGYPVMGIVDPADLDRVAQAPAGAEIEFRRVDPTSLDLPHPTAG